MKIPLFVLGLLTAAGLGAQTAPTASVANSTALLGQGFNATPANPALPTLWIIGDSTVRNGAGNGSTNAPDGQWGWGAPIEYYFNRDKINVVNRALGGTSSRTFYVNNWPAVLANVKQGDFVIMQFGHNDKNGDLTGMNATIGSLNGIGDETQEAAGRNGQTETVHTFGWYMKQYIEQTRAKGATPIVCSLIPRKIWEDGKIMRSNAGYFDYADWAMQAADAEKAPFVDLNAITAAKYNLLGPDKVEPMFVPIPSEHTHTNWYGAVINAESVISGLKALKDDPLAAFFSAKGEALPAFDAAKSPLDGTSTVESAAAAAAFAASLAKPAAATPAAAESTSAADLPSIYIVGDSTANTSGNGILGWGRPFADYFDPAKVRVLNRAIAARSSRSYLAEGHWDPVLAQLKPGDYVLLQFGHNDTGTPNAGRAGDRPSLPGLGDDTQEVPLPAGARITVGLAPPKDGDTGPMAIVHTYGWYMRKYIADAKAKGAHVIVLGVTARDIWSNPNATFGKDVSQTATIVSKNENYNPADDRIERGLEDGHGHNYLAEAREIARSQNVPFIDLTDIDADMYEKMGREKAMLLFPHDHTHSSPEGADLNAANVVSGLKTLPDSPFLALLSAKGQGVPAADAKYVTENAPGAARGQFGAPSAGSSDGYLHPGGDRPAIAPTPDYPQPPLDTHDQDVPRATQMGTEAVSGAPGGGYYDPPVPADPKLPTLWIIGDSTVRNGTLGNGVSNFNEWGWGAPLVGYFDAKKINVVNRAYGGTSSRSFYDGFFWKNLLPQIKPGDYVILQFGANDNAAASLDGTGDETRASPGRRGGAAATLHTFGWYLKQFVAETRAKGATCIICSLTPRKTWVDGKMDDQNNHVAWAAQAAHEAGAPYIDLHELIQRQYDDLGPDKVNHLYAPWPSASNPRGEGLHTGWDGAVVNAERVVSGIKALKDVPLAGFLSDKSANIAPAPADCVAANPETTPAANR